MAQDISANTLPQVVKMRLQVQDQIQALELKVQAYQSSFKKTVKDIEEAIRKEPANTTYPWILGILQKAFAEDMQESHGGILTMHSQLREIENLQPKSTHITQSRPHS